MKRGIELAILFLIFLSFVTLHFLILLKDGFTPINYLFWMGVILVGFLIVAYIFLNSIKEKNIQFQRDLEHLIKEILHEINIPISTIKTNIYLIKRKLKDQRDIARVERIEKSISKLEYLYRKISHFIKRDLYKIEREKVSLDKVIKERVEIFEDFGKNRFILDLEPLVVEIDKFALEEALDNLIENSMKYSDKDIKIELKGDILTIKDRGVGMEPSELLRVFERYYQGKGAKKGEGIGLYLVKRFCDEEDILLKIESQKDQGTSVILDFSKRVVKNGV